MGSCPRFEHDPFFLLSREENHLLPWNKRHTQTDRQNRQQTTDASKKNKELLASLFSFLSSLLHLTQTLFRVDDRLLNILFALVQRLGLTHDQGVHLDKQLLQVQDGLFETFDLEVLFRDQAIHHLGVKKGIGEQEGFDLQRRRLWVEIPNLGQLFFFHMSVVRQSQAPVGSGPKGTLS